MPYVVLQCHLIRDLDEFYHFVDAITTPDGVGGDTAEDIFGGLNAVLRLNWPRVGTKVCSYTDKYWTSHQQMGNISTTITIENGISRYTPELPLPLQVSESTPKH